MLFEVSVPYAESFEKHHEAKKRPTFEHFPLEKAR